MVSFEVRSLGIVATSHKTESLPSLEHVHAYQHALRNHCLDKKTNRDNTLTSDKNGITPSISYLNDDGLIVISFNRTRGDLITVDVQRTGVYNRVKETHIIGSRVWVKK